MKKRNLFLLSFVFGLGITPPLFVLNNKGDELLNQYKVDNKLSKVVSDNYEEQKKLTVEQLKAMSFEERTKLKIFNGVDSGAMTAIRNQKQEGICWAYAMAAISESNILYQPEIFNQPDFPYNQSNLFIDPNNIDYTLNRRSGSLAEDPLGLTSQDRFSKDLGGNTPVYNFTIPQIFFQGRSPIQFTDRAHSYIPNGKPVARLTDVVSIPNDKNGKSNVEEIKKAVTQYGGVTINYNHSTRDFIYNANKTLPTHASAIIGWDDTISADSFHTQGVKNPASRNGAWIVKNSWGNIYPNDRGWFYLSYDSRLEEPTAVNFNTNYKESSNIYYYNGTAQASRHAATQGIDNKPVSAIFPVKKASDSVSELLKSVSFSAECQPDAEVILKVYADVEADLDNVKKDSNPESGVLVYEKKQKLLDYSATGTYKVSKTIELEEPIELLPNTKYSVVLEFVDPNKNAFLFSGETSSNDATYYKSDNGWKSLTAKEAYGEHAVASIHATTIEKPKIVHSGDKDLFNAVIKPSKESFVYSGKEGLQESLTASVLINNVEVPSSSYKLEIKKVIEPNEARAGYVSFTIVGMDGYSGYKKHVVDIKKADKPTIPDHPGLEIQGDSITVNATDSFEHPVLKYEDISLPKDFVFDNPKNNISPNASISYNGSDKNCYSTTTFPVLVNLTKTTAPIEQVSVNVLGTSTYDGYCKTPNVEVSKNNKVLTPGVDYDIDYQDNIGAGDQAKIIITGKNYFTDKKVQNFTISKADNEYWGMWLYDNKPFANFKFGQDKIQYLYYKEPECTNLVNGEPIVPGTYYVKAYVPGTNNYNELTSPDTLTYVLDAKQEQEQKPNDQIVKPDNNNQEVKEEKDNSITIIIAYVVLNILCHNLLLKNFPDYFKKISDCQVDGIICADPYIISQIQEIDKNMEVHISTQQSICNSKAALFWKDNGASRVVLGREVAYLDLKKICEKLKDVIEIEYFIHGAVCISYSGRCTMSNNYSYRDANIGGCAHSCRWLFNVENDNIESKFTMSAKDMALINELDKLLELDIASFKIEGRMKSVYYISTIVSLYRKAIDSYKETKKIPSYIIEDIKKSENRETSTGCFFTPSYNKMLYTDENKVKQLFAFVIEQQKEDVIEVICKNNFNTDMEFECIRPNKENITFKILSMLDDNNEPVYVANKPMRKYYIKINKEVILEPKDIVRINEG